MILGRGPAFFSHCKFTAKGPYMWIRNTNENHGNVFLNCDFVTAEGKETVLARAPTNHGKNYPYSEAVLINCRLQGIAPEGWGKIGDDTKNIRYWEFNSTNIADGMPVDVSKRHSASRQLTMEEDSALIANYSNPAYVLENWTPSMAPEILSSTQDQAVNKGDTISLKIEAVAVPEARYQWFKNGELIEGAIESSWTIYNFRNRDAGEYSIVIKNEAGKITSRIISLTLK
jgi:hypothetical protein